MTKSIDNELDEILIPFYMKGRESFTVTIHGKLDNDNKIFSMSYTLFKKAVENLVATKQTEAYENGYDDRSLEADHELEELQATLNSNTKKSTQEPYYYICCTCHLTSPHCVQCKDLCETNTKKGK